MPESLAAVSPDLIAKFFTTVKDYEQCYADGHTAFDIDDAVKKYKSQIYKSHRRIYSINE